MTDLSTIAAGFYERYAYPADLRQLSSLVGRIAGVIAAARAARGDALDVDSVTLAGYLHDIGRSPLLTGDPRDHNELSALILAAEGLAACVEPARRHAIDTVLDPATAPRRLADQIVYVADRRGGMEIEPIAERAKDTAARNPKYAAEIKRAVPLALAIEREVFAGLPFAPEALGEHVAVAS